MSPRLLGAAVAILAAAPSLSLHAIFTGGQTTGLRAGQVLHATVRDGGGQGIRSVCWEPAPIDRPACGPARTGAPARAGVQRVVVTLSDASTLTRSVRIGRPARRFGGRTMAPARITCARAGLYRDYDRRRRRSTGLIRRLPRGTRVGVSDRVAPGRVFTWHYATAQGGVALERCARPGL